MEVRMVRWRKCGRGVLGRVLVIVAVAFTLERAAVAQEQAQPAESVADAARAAREKKSNSPKPAKIVTTDDLVPPVAAAVPVNATTAEGSGAPATGATVVLPPGAVRVVQAVSAGKPAEAAAVQAADCSSPADERLKEELQAAQDESEQLTRELSYDPKVISDRDVDMSNFKPGSSGVSFSSPPLSDATPQSPARIAQVQVNDKIASLKKALTIACSPPEDAKTLEKIFELESQLKEAQRVFELDSSSYYSKTDYAQDTSGRAKLDGEQEQIQSLQEEIERLKSELPAENTEQSPY
jgi:hypothetical protein